MARPESETYEPSSRRPIADMLRRTAHWSTAACVRMGIHPNAISLGSIVAATGAGGCFLLAGEAIWLLIPAALLCYLRLWFNMLDGMVALSSGKASRSGEIFNELPDRVSDVLIFVGVAHSGLAHAHLAYWVAIAALLVAYVGTFGQAVGVHREFSGVMAKPWRMVALHIGAWITLAMHYAGNSLELGPAGLTWLDWTHIVILAGCLQSIWVRLARILRALQTEGT